MNDQRLRWLLTAGALSISGALGLVALSRARPRSAANGALSGVFEVIANAAPATQAAPNAVPVLVELFTSEGCSSCPPADAVLARLEHSQPIAGARVVPVAHHVDYWNGLGWPDPFSSPQATLRQQAYQALGSGIYTPQAVIDGSYEVNGSSRAALGKAIRDAANRPHATVSLSVVAGDGAALAVTLKVGALPAGSAADAEAIVALTQNAVTVSVGRGENAGRTLDHAAVNRALLRAGDVAASGAALTVSLAMPQGLSASDMRVVAFVQERGSRKVLGSAIRDASSQ